MSTGDKLVSLYLKKFLPQQQFRDQFQLVLRKYTEDLYRRIFPDAGVYRGGILSSSAPDTFDVSTPLEGTQSEGKDIEFDPSLGSQVPFENALASLYYVGLRHTTIPSDVEVNVRTGDIKYVFEEEAIGERADPDLVVDDTDGTLTIRVNSVTEASVDHSGRSVLVFLKETENGGSIGPQTLITPFETLAVQYDGTNNYIETTTGLGQSATSLSTTASDYEVVLIGPSVKKNTDLRLIDEVIFLGIVTGAGTGNSPTVFDQTDRIVLGVGGSGGTGSPQIFAILETAGTIEHSDVTVGQITWNQDLYYRPFGTTDELQILASNVTLADDEVAFVQVPDPFVGGTAVLQVVPRSSAGLNSPDRYWVFHRDGNVVKVRSGLQLEQGEERQLDDTVISGVINFGENDKLRFDDTTDIFHFDADGSTDNANIAIGSEVNFGDPTNNDKLSYSAGLLSVLLGNVVTSSAVSAGRFASQRANSTDTSFEALVTGDSFSRYEVDAAGKIEWSTGAAAADTDLFRGGVGILETTNILKSSIGQLTLNDIDIVRDTASLLSISQSLRIDGLSVYFGAEANNDIMRFVEGGTPRFEWLTNNVEKFRIEENGSVTAANKLISTTGILRINDIELSRESSTVARLASSLNVATGIIYAITTAQNDFLRFVNSSEVRWELVTNNVVRFRANEDGEAIAEREVRTDSGTTYTRVHDGAGLTVPSSLNEVYDRTRARNLLRITPNNAADKAINVASAQDNLESGDKIGLVDSNSLRMDFGGSTIDFGTGTVSVGNNFTAHTPTAAVRFFKYGIGLNASNEIVVVVPTNDFASRALSDADFTEPAFTDILPVGQITVESISTTPGDIQNIEDEDIFYFSSSGSGTGGGGGELTDFVIKQIVGNVATIDKGTQILQNRDVLITGVGTTQAALPADFTINLDTILGSTPPASTSFWLYIDKDNIESPFTLTDNSRPVIRINSETDFALLTTEPKATNPIRYLPVGQIFSGSDSTWTGPGSSFNTTAVLRETFDGFFFSQVEHGSDTTTVAETSKTFAHGLSGKPQIVEAFYDDGTNESPVDDQTHIINVDETNITYSTFGKTFGGGESFTVRAVYIQPPGGNIATANSELSFGPFINTATTTIAHGLDVALDIRGMFLIEHDVTADRYRILDNTQLVQDFDDTNLYFNWSGLSPSATLTYTLVLGGSTLPTAIHTTFGGFTKFVGTGPGSFSTLTAAMSGCAPGDSILVTKGYSITVQEDINCDDINIVFMPNVIIESTAIIAESALKITGDRVDIKGLDLTINHAGVQPLALLVQGDDCNIVDSRIHLANAGLTITDVFKFDTGADRNYANIAVRNSGATISGSTLVDLGTNNDQSVRG